MYSAESDSSSQHWLYVAIIWGALKHQDAWESWLQLAWVWLVHQNFQKLSR